MLIELVTLGVMLIAFMGLLIGILVFAANSQARCDEEEFWRHIEESRQHRIQQGRLDVWTSGTVDSRSNRK